ncbi:MAG: hypothetical protein QM737_18950 [Ferruginibacter sp.]
MKKIISFIAVSITLFTLVIQFVSCTKKDTVTVTNTITKTDTVKCTTDTSILLSTSTWSYFSINTLSIVQPGPATYFNQNDTLIGLGQGYRLGGRLQTTKEFNISNKVLYYKWKVLSGGQFAGIVPQLKYDPNTTDSNPAIQNVDFITHSTTNSYNGSILVEENIWYYTRIASMAGTDNFECTTAVDNYSNLSGTIVGTTTIPVYTKSGYIAIRIGDCYAGTNSSILLAECKIQSN